MKNVDIAGVSELMEFYKDLEVEINVARKAANFYCLEGCGACCYTPAKNLEVTLFEAIPIAYALIEQGVHEHFLHLLERVDADEITCVLYTKNSDDGRLGGCVQYEARPLICRLFGSSNKGGKSALNTAQLPIVCKPLRAIHFDDADKVATLVKLLPVASVVSKRARALNLQLSGELFSINEAIRRALYYVLQRMEYGQHER